MFLSFSRFCYDLVYNPTRIDLRKHWLIHRLIINHISVAYTNKNNYECDASLFCELNKYALHLVLNIFTELDDLTSLGKLS